VTKWAGLTVFHYFDYPITGDHMGRF